MKTSPERMRDLLRHRLHRGLHRVPQVASLTPAIGDHDLTPDLHEELDADRILRPAAVLVPIVERPEGETVLLTLRSDHLNDHAGQVAFPGGRVDEGDAGPAHTALREAQEEVGLGPEFVDVIGALDIYETRTGFSITPVVGMVAPGFNLVLDEFEVAEAFEVPLAFFLDPANHTMDSQFWKGAMRHYYDMPYEGFRIWGATAAMLVNLSKKLGG